MSSQAPRAQTTFVPSMERPAEVTEISFVASLPPIKSAIVLDGLGDGGQVKLEVSRTDVKALLQLQEFFTERSFMVTITSLNR